MFHNAWITPTSLKGPFTFLLFTDRTWPVVFWVVSQEPGPCQHFLLLLTLQIQDIFILFFYRNFILFSFQPTPVLCINDLVVNTNTILISTKCNFRSSPKFFDGTTTIHNGKGKKKQFTNRSDWNLFLPISGWRIRISLTWRAFELDPCQHIPRKFCCFWFNTPMIHQYIGQQLKVWWTERKTRRSKRRLYEEVRKFCFPSNIGY